MKKIKKWFYVLMMITIFLGILKGQTGTLSADYDPTFREKGFVINNSSETESVAINNKGHIIAANVTALTIYDANGKVMAIKSIPIMASRVAVQSNNYIVTAGRIIMGKNGESDIGIARYDTSLNLDPNFGVNGIVQSKVNGLSRNVPLALSIQSDGKILIGGRVNNTGADYQQFLTRLTYSGQLDTTFRGGIFIEGEGFSHDFSSISILENRLGRTIVVGGHMKDCSAYGCPIYSTVRVYDGNGFRIPSFNSGQTFKIPGDWGTATVQPDGKIVIADIDSYTSVSFGIARILSSGGMDSTFGNGGIVTIPVSNFPNINTVRVDSFGRIIAVGRMNDGQGDKIFIARFNPNGTLDSNFSYTQRPFPVTTGYRALSFPNEPNHISFGFVLQGGKILIFGRLGSTSVTNRSVLVRLNSQ